MNQHFLEGYEFSAYLLIQQNSNISNLCGLRNSFDISDYPINMKKFLLFCNMGTENFIRYIRLSDKTESDISEFYCNAKYLYSSISFFWSLNFSEKNPPSLTWKSVLLSTKNAVIHKSRRSSSRISEFLRLHISIYLEKYVM